MSTGWHFLSISTTIIIRTQGELWKKASTDSLCHFYFLWCVDSSTIWIMMELTKRNIPFITRGNWSQWGHMRTRYIKMHPHRKNEVPMYMHFHFMARWIFSYIRSQWPWPFDLKICVVGRTHQGVSSYEI
jgi:hypothetical protein